MTTEQTDATESSDQLTVGDLIRLFEESEEATFTARQESERDRDYVDNKQLTSEELGKLKKRSQPPYIDNVIKTKIDFLVGLEKQQRINPVALPRTPKHEDDADAASQALRYVADIEDYDAKRSAVWRNLLVEGVGGISVSVEPSRYRKPMDAAGMMGSTAMSPPTEYDILLRRVAWDRIFYDPHSSELDFSDAGYKGVVVWMDYADALKKYPEGKDILESTLSQSQFSTTYDDKPKYQIWADHKRKRVRIVQIWIKRDEEWHFAEFTKAGILKAGPSPYVTDRGESDCELILQSAYVDRDNNRYGLVREMVTVQDGINKRHSKALHLLNTAQIVTEDGALNDIELTRREAARPDGVIIVNPGFGDKFKFETRVDLADAQFRLLQEAKNSIEVKGPNATMQGENTGGTNSASGKAIIASQQGGMVSLGDLLDSLRHLDKRVFRAIWNRIRQFWTAEKWIRTTDDEKNLKWVGLNRPITAAEASLKQFEAQGATPEQLQEAQATIMQDPAANQVVGVENAVAELDCDIILDEAPDAVTPALEQWQALTELAKSGVPIPPDVLIEAAPNLKNKDRLLERMRGKTDPAQQQEQQLAKELQLKNALAEIADKEASADQKRSAAFVNIAKAGATTLDALAPPEPPTGPMQGRSVAQQPQQPQQIDPRIMEELQGQQPNQTFGAP